MEAFAPQMSYPVYERMERLLAMISAVNYQEKDWERVASSLRLADAEAAKKQYCEIRRFVSSDMKYHSEHGRDKKVSKLSIEDKPGRKATDKIIASFKAKNHENRRVYQSPYNLAILPGVWQQRYEATQAAKKKISAKPVTSSKTIAAYGHSRRCLMLVIKTDRLRVGDN